MKLLSKIMAFVFIGIIVLVAIDGYLSIRRERDLFDNDMRRNALLLGHTIKGLVVHIWEQGGEDLVLDLIKEIDREEHKIRVRWVWLDARPGDTFAPRVSRKELDPAIRGKDISFKKTEGNGPGHVYTYIPLPVDTRRHGALELSESLQQMHDYIHETVERSIALAGLIVVASWAVLLLLGVRFVGWPLKQLTEKTQKIGAGDLSSDLLLPGRDEFSTLAQAINRMCEDLTASRQTARKELEARIAILEQLRHTERLATLGRLSSGIAHELGTPLNVIAGRAKMIAAEDLNREEMHTSAGIIEAQAARMTKIVRQFLDYARRPASNRTLEDMGSIVKQVLDLLRQTAQKGGVLLTFAKNDDLPSVRVDSSQIQQALMNIVMNGIQAMPDGGRLELGFYLKRTRPPSHFEEGDKVYVALYVRDQGIGISPESEEHIFEPFFTTKGPGQGTGLGLPIVQEIIHDHGGWIEVESEPGKGTCFTIYLPSEAEK